MGLFINSKTVADLRERVDKLETAQRQLSLEWLSTYDKFRSILARIAKRQEREQQATGESAPGSQEGAEAGSTPSSLSQRQREVNARILARRNRSEVEQ
jgi:hypothetical protein